MARRRKTRLNQAAVNVGSALGRVAAKVDRLKQQRQAIAAEIQQVIGAAEKMLGDLGGKASAATRSVAARRRTLSAEARERIADAQRKRWAKVRAAKK